jgi:hypothetical protein
MKAARRIAVITTFAFLALAAPASAEFSIAGFSASTTGSLAGGHPDVTTNVVFPTIPKGPGIVEADGDVRTLAVQLPPGLLGDPSAVPQCSQAEFAESKCQPEAQVGWAALTMSANEPNGGSQFPLEVPVFNLQPRNEDVTGEVAFSFSGLVTILLPIEVRSDGDYGLSVVNRGINRVFTLDAVDLTIWGVPGDPSHDSQRFNMSLQPLDPGPLPRTPFYTNPTSCGGELPLHAEATSYQDPSKVVEADTTLPAITGCDEVEFDPTLKARPTTNVADSPSGFDVDLEVPQNLDPDGLASAHLRDATVTLPEGLVVNPSSANGLEACSPVQIGLKSAVGDPDAHFGLEPTSCPDASRIGTVEVETPAFEDPLKGSVYLATPHRNPFGSLLALYLTVQGHGLDIKLAGKVETNPKTGRITSTFEENPQLPVEHLRLHLFQGAFAPLRTPATCSTYTTTSSLTPWSAPESGPPATPKDEYAIDHAPGGGSCPRSEAELANSPSFEAGSSVPVAGAFRPFVVNLSREDDTQQFGAVTVTPPPGLLAKLAGTENCPDLALALAAGKSGEAEEASPSCPANSKVGQVFVRAGAGPKPYTAPGTAYLAGPYKGAPLSLAIVTPAVAGPFDLGTVVVRTALYLDPKTTRITAKSDPIPSILQGIPLDIRSVSIRLDRPEFTLNPTNCNPLSVEASLLTTSGATAALANRFQVGDCGRLGFKPKIRLALKGGTKRTKYPALTAVLQPRAGDANIASVSVALPHSEFLAQEHIRTVCTRVQFAADQCPKASIYGQATVTTPLLGYRLSGPVYLRSSDNPLPDLVPDLRGPANQPIRVETAGRTDTVNGGIRNTFDSVPDVPFTKFVLRMQGGKKGLLVNSRGICAGTNRATVSITAQNGAIRELRPVLKAKCGKKSTKKGRGRH